jgi:uncharacterized protein DUF4349
MTAAELSAQIRAARPTAPAHLRERVRAIAATKPAPTFRSRLRLPRLRLVLPAAAAVAVGVAAAIAFVHPQANRSQTAAVLDAATQRSGPATSTIGAPTAPEVANGSVHAPAFKAATAAPAPTPGRATRYAAQLTISVKNGNALSDATARAQSIARQLGGYVVNVSFASSDSGAASLTLRVPTAQVQDALTRLTALGRVTAQQVQIDDLQATLDQLDRQVTVLRARIAHITALLTDTTLTAVRRADLESQRTSLQNALRATHQNRAGTARDAQFATIQLQLQTAAKSVAPPPSRASRILHQAGRILAWEGAAVLYVLVVAGPLALVALAFAFAARLRRRNGEDRLLARS